MVSRRDFLTALSLSLSGLAGCPNREEKTERPPTVETTRPTQSPSPEQTETQSPTGSPSPKIETTEATDTPIPDQYIDRFDTIYDVTEEGADPTGEEVVDSHIQPLVDDDTLLWFPPGTYRLDDLAVEDVTNFGIATNEATLKLNRRGRAIFLGCRRVTDLLIDGFTIDNTVSNTAAWCDVRCVGGQNIIRNYTVSGFVDVTSRTNGFTIMVEGASTSVEFDTVDLGNGGIGGAAAFVFPRREFYDQSREAGSLTFRDCVMKDWGVEGLYASAHEGPIRVIGGEYANNALAQIRVGAGNAPEKTIVRDVSVTVDKIPEYISEESRTLRGIWLKEGDKAVIENCDVTLKNLDRHETPGAIIINNQFGRATIRDSTINTEAVSRPAIVVKRPTDTYDPGWMPSLDKLPEQWNVNLENVTITGESPETESIRISGRNGCTISDVSIDKSGNQAGGLHLSNVDDCALESGSIATEQFPVVIDFDGKDECVLEISDPSLTSTDVESSDAKISSDRSSTYCIGTDAISETKHDDSERLALTRTEKKDDRKTPGGTQLYGHWLPP